MPRGSLLILASLIVAVQAEATSYRQLTVPVRKVSAPVISDSGLFGSIGGVRHLSDGRVLVNDQARLRLVALDSSLKRVMSVADSTGIPHRYGIELGILIPYDGDSTAIYQVNAGTLTVFDGMARLARITTVPKAGDRIPIVTPFNGMQAFDPRGRHIYRTNRPSPLDAVPAQPRDSGVMTVIVQRDSAPIVRADPNTGQVDTLGLLSLPPAKRIRMSLGGGGSSSYAAVNPLPLTDDWVVLPDGTVALIRGIDYHIDWVAPDGTKSSSPKMPFAWRQVTDAEKQRMLDSAKKAYDDRIANAPPPRPTVGIGGVIRTPPPPRPFAGVDLAEMADYYPPIRAGQVRVDREGNIWILPTTSTMGTAGVVYDVVNRKGEVFERVEIPTGRNIVGFGPGGIVYMMPQSNPGNPRLERARIIR
jgi:hypothetical protein